MTLITTEMLMGAGVTAVIALIGWLINRNVDGVDRGIASVRDTLTHMSATLVRVSTDLELSKQDRQNIKAAIGDLQKDITSISSLQSQLSNRVEDVTLEVKMYSKQVDAMHKRLEALEKAFSDTVVSLGKIDKEIYAMNKMQERQNEKSNGHH